MSDERKKNGTGDGDRERKSTPAIGLATPETTAERVRQLSATLGRTRELCGDVERLVLEGGYDSRTRTVMEELAEHFEDLSNIAAGTSRSLRRLATS